MFDAPPDDADPADPATGATEVAPVAAEPSAEPPGSGSASAEEEKDEERQAYCFCHGPALEEPMIMCDACEQWYHFVCLRLPDGSEPEDMWKCPKCRGEKFPAIKQDNPFYTYRQKYLQMVRRKREFHRRAGRQLKREFAQWTDSSSGSEEESAATSKPDKFSKNKVAVGSSSLSALKPVGKGKQDSAGKTSKAGSKRKAAAVSKAERRDAKVKPASPTTQADRKRERVRTMFWKRLFSNAGATEALSTSVESAIFDLFGETGKPFMSKARELVSSLRQNQKLLRKVVSGEATPERLVRMTSDELASDAMRKQREKHRQEYLHDRFIPYEMRAELLKNGQQIVAASAAGGVAMGRAGTSIDTLLKQMEEDLTASKNGPRFRVCVSCGKVDKTRSANFCPKCGSQMENKIKKQKQTSPDVQVLKSVLKSVPSPTRKRKTSGDGDLQNGNQKRKRVEESLDGSASGAVKTKAGVEAKARDEAALGGTLLPKIQSFGEFESTLNAKDAAATTEPTTKPTTVPATKPDVMDLVADLDIVADALVAVEPSATNGSKVSDDPKTNSASATFASASQKRPGSSEILWSGQIQRRSGAPCSVEFRQRKNGPSLPRLLQFDDPCEMSGRIKLRHALAYALRVLRESQSKAVLAVDVAPCDAEKDSKSYASFYEYYKAKGRAVVVDREKTDGVLLYLIPNSSDIDNINSDFRRELFASVAAKEPLILGILLLDKRKWNIQKRKQNQNASRAKPPPPPPPSSTPLLSRRQIVESGTTTTTTPSDAMSLLTKYAGSGMGTGAVGSGSSPPPPPTRKASLDVGGAGPAVLPRSTRMRGVHVARRPPPPPRRGGHLKLADQPAAHQPATARQPAGPVGQPPLPPRNAPPVPPRDAPRDTRGWAQGPGWGY